MHESALGRNRPKPAASPLAQIAAVPAGIAAFFFAKYAWTYVLAPAAGTLLSGWLAKKMMKPQHRPMLSAVALCGGIAFWCLGGLALLWALAGTRIAADAMARHPQSNLLLVGAFIEGMLALAGAFWLALRPGVLPVVILTLCQLVKVCVYVANLLRASSGADTSTALWVHLVLRCLLIFAMIRGLFILRKVQSCGDTMTDVPAVAAR